MRYTSNLEHWTWNIIIRGIGFIIWFGYKFVLSVFDMQAWMKVKMAFSSWDEQNCWLNTRPNNTWFKKICSEKEKHDDKPEDEFRIEPKCWGTFHFDAVSCSKQLKSDSYVFEFFFFSIFRFHYIIKIDINRSLFWLIWFHVPPKIIHNPLHNYTSKSDACLKMGNCRLFRWPY